MVGQRDLGTTGILDDVKIGDNMPLLVPDKPRATALRHLRHIETEEVTLPCQRGDEDHRRRGLPEERDRGALLRLECLTWGHGAWHRIGIAYLPLGTTPQRPDESEEQPGQQQPGTPMHP